MSDEVQYAEVLSNEKNLQLYQQEKALIDMQISTAKAYPRDLKKVINNCIVKVTMNTEVAKACTYTLVKGKKISGPSVKIARIIAQEMGNFRTQTSSSVSTDRTHVTSEAICFDLEKNFAHKATQKKPIVNKEGDRYSEDLIAITGNATAAVAFRNAVFTVVGEDIVNEIWEASKEKVLGKIPDEKALKIVVNKSINEIVSRYKVNNLTEKEVLMALGRESIDHVTREDIIQLVGFETAIKGGEMSFEGVFRPQTVRQQKAAPPTSDDEAAKRLTMLLNNCKTREDIKKLESHIKSNDHRELYDRLWKELK